MNRVFSCCTLFLLLRTNAALAEANVEGEVDIRIKPLNLSEYPELEFYIEYQDYYYEYGWQEGGIAEVILEEGQEYETGERGRASKLFARDADGNVFATEIELGGNTLLDDYTVSYVVHEINVTDIEDGRIDYQVEDQYKVYPTGQTKRLRKGLALTGVNIWGVDLAIVLLPILGVGGLALFFWTRRNPARSAA